MCGSGLCSVTPRFRSTQDRRAIVSGAIEAQAGAIERAWQRLAAANKTCLLSGGNAGQLARALVIPYVPVENLPLEGLRVMAYRE